MSGTGTLWSLKGREKSGHKKEKCFPCPLFNTAIQFCRSLAASKKKKGGQMPKHWLKPKEAAPYTPWSHKTIYDRIREGKFPFEFKRSGRSILISARSLGLIVEQGAENDEAREQVKT